MLVDAYPERNLFSELNFDLSMDMELKIIDPLLDDDEIYSSVKEDMSKRYPKTKGRHSTPVEVILRMIIVMKLYAWSYRDTVKYVSDSISEASIHKNLL